MLSGLLDSIIQEIGAEDRRKHEFRMQELKMIENSDLRDEYVKQLLLERILYPIEQANHDIQNAAKHAQWLSEIILFHYKDHKLTEEQAYELSKQLKLLAIKITDADSLHDLKLIYAVVTMFNDRISRFRHAERKYCIQYNIRHHILNNLNTCIATSQNFKIREELMRGMAGKSLLPGLTITYQPELQPRQIVSEQAPVLKSVVKSEVDRLRGKFGGDEEKTEIFLRVKVIMIDKLGIEDPDKITLDSHLSNHLGADELDIVELITALEDEFNIEISDTDQSNLDLYFNIGGFLSGFSSGAFSTPGEKLIVKNFVDLIYKKKRSFS